MNNDEIISEDLMLGDIIAFKNKYGKVTPPYEVEALEHNYVRALLLYRNDDTPSDEFFLDEKDSDEIVDINLTEEYISERFKEMDTSKLSDDLSEYVISDTFTFLKKEYFYVLRVFRGEFYILSFAHKCKGLMMYSCSDTVKTVRELQRELKNIERQKNNC